MAAIVQRGVSVLVGFGGHTYAGLNMETASKEQTGEQKVLLDENNEPVTVLISDLGKRITLRGIILDDGSWTEPETGDAITVNGAAYRIESGSYEYSQTEARVNITAIKEDSVEY